MSDEIKKEEPRLRNPRMIESLAAASADRISQVRATEGLTPEPVKLKDFERGNPTDKAMSLERFAKARAQALAPANDNKPVPANRAPTKAPARGRGR